ncbi:MAG: hypothetical protein ACREA2_13805, partial [Blastocatellia bacterium]
TTLATARGTDSKAAAGDDNAICGFTRAYARAPATARARGREGARARGRERSGDHRNPIKFRPA